MATDYQIVGVNKESGHGHIREVCTGSGNGPYEHKFTVAEVYARMDSGDSFHTGRVGYDYATVAKFACTHCRQDTLRSHADTEWNNNLDSLGACD